MNTSPKACLNCETSLAGEAKYCHKCGQKVTDGRITLRELISEFVDSVFNIDTKIFRTLANLFIPGKLTVEYFSGKHKSFLQPIRLFLVVTVLLIAAISYVLKDKEINPGDVQDKWEEQQQIHELLLNVDSIKTDVSTQFNDSTTTAALDTFYNKLLPYDSLYADTLQVPFTIAGSSMSYARDDLFQLSDSELIEKYFPDENIFNKVLRTQEIKLLKSNQNMIDFLLSKITWLVLVMLPFFALSLKFLYIRRKFYYVEHLIFSFHLHTFLFVWLLLITLFDEFIPEQIEALSFILVVVYIVFAMKKFYQQSWWKTIVKFFIAQFFYWFILGICMIIVGFVSLLLF